MTEGLAIIILAAGAARRMRGADKLLQDVDGLPLLHRQARMARAVTGGQVIVTLPPANPARAATLAGLDVTPLPVPDAVEGMNAGLRRAVAALPATTRAAMVMLADMPELTADDLRHLLNAVEPGGDILIWRAATEDGAPGHPIVFHARLFGALRQLTGDAGGRAIVQKAGPNVRLVPLPGQRARRDLDTPEDWAAWRAAREMAPPRG